MLLLRCLLTLLLAWSCSPSSATPGPAAWQHLSEISFRQLTREDGLPNAITTAVAQDGRGYVWIGTLSGLARWDGYRVHVYRADLHQPGSLPETYIQTLHADASGRLWVGTSGGGLARYDSTRDSFITYGAGPQGLSNVSVHAIADDGRGGLWVGTGGGLDHLDPASGRITHDAGPGSSVRARHVYTLLHDQRGRLWVGSAAGLFRRDTDDAPFQAVPLPAAKGAAAVEPQSLLEDSAGRVWVGTVGSGAFVIDADGETPRAVLESQRAPAGAELHNQQVVALAEVRPGEVWIATLSQGIVAVDTNDVGSTRRIQHQPMLPGSLADNTVRGLFRDRSGLIWAATNGGVSRHGPLSGAVLTRFANPLGSTSTGDAVRAGVLGSNISWILPMADGRFWLGTHKDGVDIIDNSGALVGALRPDATHPQTALPTDNVLALEHAPDGSVFIATERGLYRASASGHALQRVAFAGRDPAAPTWALLAAGESLWVGGVSDGLWKFDLRRGVATPMLQGAAHTLSDQRITVLAPGPAGSLWVGTRHGLNRFDPATGSVWRLLPKAAADAPGLASGFISALYTDQRQRLWIGSYGGGIDILENARSTSPGSAPRLQHLAMPQGLPDDTVNAIIEDHAGKVWVSTDNGLAKVEPTTLAVQALRRADGVVFPTYWAGSAARSASGDLLFGGTGGFTVVRPERLRRWNGQAPVVVTDIQAGNQHLLPGAPVELTAEANHLAVEFAALDYSAPERNRYAYKLEGFDPDWVASDATRRVASYTNLPPGRYRLLLRGSNRDGVWSEAPATLTLRVLPAWYQTLWLRAAALLGLLALLYATVQVRTRLLRANQAKLERMVQERTADLEELSRALERSSLTDPLTGLHNRRFLTEHIDAEIAASLRRANDTRATSGRAAVDADNVFFVIDVDHFKRVNDLQGHDAGDHVLQEVARRLRAVMRESDHLVRWGGEEFLAVARDTDRGRAEELAERLRAAIGEREFVLADGRRLALSCSIGFACMPFVDATPRVLGWQDVVSLADLAMLAAKRAGRNGWVGLHAGDNARAEGLLTRLHHAPQQSAARHEVRFTSSRGPDTVFAALLPESSDEGSNR